MKLLRENGVEVRTQFSLVPAAAFASISAKVTEEKAKIEARKAKKSVHSSESDNSRSPVSAGTRKSGVVLTSTVKGGAVKVSVTRRAAPKPAVSVPVSTKTQPPKVTPAGAPRTAAPVPQAPKAPVPVTVTPPPAAVKTLAPAPVVAKTETVVTPQVPPQPVVRPSHVPHGTPAATSAPANESKPVSKTASHVSHISHGAVTISPSAKPAPVGADLKQAELKAQIFKPDAAVLARIEKSRQQAAQAQNNRGRSNNNRGGSNQQGYTGSFGRPAPSGGGSNNTSSGNSPRSSGAPYHSGSGSSGGSRPPYNGGNRGGFSGHSMQDAFGAANRGPSSPGAFPAPAGPSTPGKSTVNRHVGPKHKRGGKDNKLEYQKEQQEMVRQNVSRVMASLSKHPVKKTYHRDHENGNDGIERKILKTSDFITVGELAGLMEQMPARVIAKCMEMGMMVTINARLDFESIQVLADEFGFEAQLMEEYEEEVLGVEEEVTDDLVSRHPVVTVMGHVDHGKTSLLDWIRKTHVVSGESGGITQHIGAYEVKTSVGKVTFLDTPGHEAFSAMRARGSQVTDVIVLVVAADSMVMPQTVESIELAHREKVPIVVAITKVDLPTANPDKIRAQLAERGVEVEQWGGNTSCIEVSARSGLGMQTLLETLALETEVLDLKANKEARARGAVVESKLDAGKGSMATILIQNGTLHVGDPFVCGIYSGRVRAMFDDRGAIMKEAGPSTPCQVLGFDGTPQAGDDLVVVEDEKAAREIASKRRMAARERDLRARKTVSLEKVYDSVKEGAFSELNLIVKADVGGSSEAIAASLEKLSNREVKINIIRKGVGAITDSDILLATSAQAIIIAFHLMPSLSIREMAEKEGVEIKTYRIIYEIIDDIKNAVEGLLKPTTREEIVGEAEIREVFKIPKIGLIAGCMVTDGEVNRNSRVHVYREGVELGLTEVQSLKRHKDDVKSVARGFDCGIGLKGYDNIQAGDVLMFFKEVSVARTLADVARDEAAAKDAKEAAAAAKDAATAAKELAAAATAKKKDAE
jgi:translation initiation factor IF-2